PTRPLLDALLHSLELRCRDEADRHSVVYESGHDPIDAMRQRFAVITMWPKIMSLVQAQQQITALQHILDAVAQFMCLGVKVYTDSKTAGDSAIKACIVAGRWYLDVARTAGVLLAPGGRGESLSGPGVAFDNGKAATCQAVIQSFTNLTAKFCHYSLRPRIRPRDQTIPEAPSQVCKIPKACFNARSRIQTESHKVLGDLRSGGTTNLHERGRGITVGSYSCL